MRSVIRSVGCSFCFCPESLLHFISECKTYLDEGRFTKRHNLLLNFIASSLLYVERFKLYVDLPGFISPSVLISDQLRPDLLLTFENKILYILEFTAELETHLKIKLRSKTSKLLPIKKMYTIKSNLFTEA